VALVKYDVTIRSDSDLSLTDAISWTQNYVDGFQSADPRNHIFADLFDARSGFLYRIFSTAAKAAYGIGESFFSLSADLTAINALSEKISLLTLRVAELEKARIASGGTMPRTDSLGGDGIGFNGAERVYAP
jgi:hypothetical protein